MMFPFDRRQALWATILFLSVLFSIDAANAYPQPAGQKPSLLSELWTPKEAEAVEEETITIMLTGDMMLGRYIATLRDRALADAETTNDLFPFTYMPQVLTAVKTALNATELDIVAGNLEGPIVENQVAYGDMVFRFAPEVASLLKNVGFTTLQLANNHSFNQTREGLNETYNHLHNAGLDAFGYPDTPQGEFSFIRYDFGEQSVGFLGLNDTDFKLDMDEVTARIAELDPQVDTLIVGIHWGFEYEPTARESVVNKAHQMVDAGADFIWGTHPHVVQNSEFYNGKWIYYSLGNFVFDQYWSDETQEGLVLGLTITPPKEGESDLIITPVEIMVDLVNLGEPTPRN